MDFSLAKLAISAPAAICSVTLVACSGSTNIGESPLPSLSSSPAQWRASVCDSNGIASLNPRQEGLDAYDLAVCMSSNPETEAYISSGRYSSPEKLQYYITNYGAFLDSPYATASTAEGQVWAFIAFSGGIRPGKLPLALALDPLRRFGFQIHDAQGAASQPLAPSIQPSQTHAPRSTANTSPVPPVGTGKAQYVRTMSGQVRCGVMVAQVACERASAEGFLQAPLNTQSAGSHWNLAMVSPDGRFNWDVGNIGGAYINQDITMNYGQSYTYNGWTLEPSSDGTRITNNATGHGMFVSVQNVYAF